MPRWTPHPVWEGEDVFIIGGGSSLRNFDWSLLKTELTIGCNDAYRLGADICTVCLFGDIKWYREHHDQLSVWEGTAFSCVPHLLDKSPNWLWTLCRRKSGLHTDAVGWNDNTGASAINLALLMGAYRVFLLGFDMKEGPADDPNWHDERVEKHIKGLYASKFLKHFPRIKADLHSKFPGREIHNINDDSALQEFPIIGVDEFWSQRVKNRKAG